MWTCRDCGHREKKWSGNCSMCNQWGTLDAESGTTSGAKPVLIQDVDTTAFKRIPSGYKEIDRLFGGGAVQGSLSLMAGEPGIGKSTMMLQLAARYATQGLTVLYVCGEESAEQTSLRARRLNIQAKNLYLLSETDLNHIKSQIATLKPDILIVDSVQIVYKKELSSAPGSVSQVKEVAMEMMEVAKGQGITTYLIGHVTKSGEIAGPRVLEHLVDTVFEFEGDRQHGYRIVRAIKNRFGPTDDVALFQMVENGLREVENPSAAFLQERLKNIAGSSIIPTIEGTRSILVEVQALVSYSSFSTSSRRSAGVDQKRLALLLAVLEKRLAYNLHAMDVFVSVTGGLKIDEPAIDLGIILAIASSFLNRALDPLSVAIGEVGLSGEVRSVPRIEARIKEAINMGFKRIYLPMRNLKGLNKELTAKVELKGIQLVEEAVKMLLG
ncbi:MAG: DNA repair protein RadA [Chlamydiia bacterium]|nr:DNA repair protein RadA [Chlamydiia bacterium]MCH9629972.1 DNA repair protein RadA [Chlamydiia bacterium]